MIKFIKMKKKIIFAVATGFFAAATVFNMNLLQGNSAGDVSLDAIGVMAQAQTEGGSAKRCVRFHDEGCFWYEGTTRYPSCNTCK